MSFSDAGRWKKLGVPVVKGGQNLPTPGWNRVRSAKYFVAMCPPPPPGSGIPVLPYISSKLCNFYEWLFWDYLSIEGHGISLFMYWLVRYFTISNVGLKDGSHITRFYPFALQIRKIEVTLEHGGFISGSGVRNFLNWHPLRDHSYIT